MRKSLIILGTVIGSLVCLLVYCAMLIDWVQDYKTGLYVANHAEALLETTAILVYTVGGFTFFKHKVLL
jgi:hypothetical protein